MSDMGKDDLSEIFSLVQAQLSEDRESINELYEELRGHVKDHPLRFVDLGEVLAKLADLKLKQTHQVLDMFKTLQKSAPKDDGFRGLDDDDLALINKELNPDGDK